MRRANLRFAPKIFATFSVEDMIKEVDVDGDGRIDFYEFVNALGEPGNDDSFDEEEDDYISY